MQKQFVNAVIDHLVENKMVDYTALGHKLEDEAEQETQGVQSQENPLVDKSFLNRQNQKVKFNTLKPRNVNS